MASEIDVEEVLRKTPDDIYRPIAKKAADRIPPISEDPELYAMLFSKDELEWLQKQYKERHTSP